MKRCIAILLTLLLLTACGGGQAPASEPESSPSSISEPAPELTSSQPDPESEPDSQPDPEPPAAAEKPAAPETDFEAVPPDPGTGEIQKYDEEALRVKVVAMANYLEENLDPGDYGEIWPVWGLDFEGTDISCIEIPTPSPDTVKSVVEKYTGEPVTVKYLNAEFSKKQLEQAREDWKRFQKEHPEIEVLGWRSQLGLFSGWIINLKESNDMVTEFVNTYPIPDIYEVVIGETTFPD